MDYYSSNNNDFDGYGASGSKRQRFYNLMKTTKEVYIPNISQKTMETIKSTTNSINNYATEPSSFSSPSNTVPASSPLPHNMDINFYPTYTSMLKDRDSYETVIRFSVSAPGDPSSRKNKLVVSLCKQFLKPSTILDDETIEVELDELNSLTNDSHISRVDTNLSTANTEISGSTLAGSFSVSQDTTSNKNEVEVLESRIAGFISKKVSGLPAVIDLFRHINEKICQSTFATTDNMGQVLIKITTDFLPDTIRISLDTPSDYPNSISKIYPIDYIKPGGIGLISDIDDTIKHTGVTGDKKSMFRNVFIQNEDSWLIDGVPLWYNTLRDYANTNFFYVSNSPLQIYPLLEEYVTKNLPQGPLFLKQYSGNLLSSIMTSSANRKLTEIIKILQDFPDMKFFLVGDSGEQDFEAYTSTALQFPNQIMGIYIRCCKNSMSDLGMRESDVMNELNAVITREFLITKEVQQQTLRRRPPPPPLRRRKPELNDKQQLDIKESRSNDTILETNLIPPPLPSRPVNNSPPIGVGINNYFDDTTSPYFDRKAESWKSRVIDSTQKLKTNGNSNLGIRLMFFSEPSIALDDTMLMIKNTTVNSQ